MNALRFVLNLSRRRSNDMVRNCANVSILMYLIVGQTV